MWRKCEIMKLDLKFSGIYCIENSINHKKYVGQAINIRNRFYSHNSDFKIGRHSGQNFQKEWELYGDNNFTAYLLEKCLPEELNKLEMKWISILKTNVEKYGYNSTNGGDNAAPVDELRRRISEACKQNYKDTDFVNRNNKLRADLAKDVYQIDLNGNIVKLWIGGCREASKALGFTDSGIYSAANKKILTYKNYIWIYKDEYENSLFDIRHYISNNGSLRNNKVVYQYCYNGELVKKWDDINLAREEYDVESIRKVCSGIYHLHKDYLWSYSELSKNQVIQQFLRQFPSAKPIICINHNILFYSINKACEFAGLKKNSVTSLSRAANGIIKTSGKSPYTKEPLIWKWFEKEENFDSLKIIY